MDRSSSPPQPASSPDSSDAPLSPVSTLEADCVCSFSPSREYWEKFGSTSRTVAAEESSGRYAKKKDGRENCGVASVIIDTSDCLGVGIPCTDSNDYEAPSTIADSNAEPLGVVRPCSDQLIGRGAVMTSSRGRVDARMTSHSAAGALLSTVIVCSVTSPLSQARNVDRPIRTTAVVRPSSSEGYNYYVESSVDRAEALVATDSASKTIHQSDSCNVSFTHDGVLITSALVGRSFHALTSSNNTDSYLGCVSVTSSSGLCSGLTSPNDSIALGSVTSSNEASRRGDDRFSHLRRLRACDESTAADGGATCMAVAAARPVGQKHSRYDSGICCVSTTSFDAPYRVSSNGEESLPELEGAIGRGCEGREEGDVEVRMAMEGLTMVGNRRRVTSSGEAGCCADDVSPDGAEGEWCEIERKTFEQDENGDTPLHEAIILQQSAAFISTLIQPGLNEGLLDAQNFPHRLTALQLAVVAGRPEVVRLLALRGASLKARDRRGDTSLHIACRLGHASCLRVLLDVVGERSRSEEGRRGDNLLKELVAILNFDGETCVHLAMRSNYETFTTLVSALVQSNIDINLPEGRRGMTPLHLAAELDDVTLISFLLPHSDPHEVTFDRRTALDLTRVNGRNSAQIRNLLEAAGASKSIFLMDLDEDSDGDDEMMDTGKQ